MTSIPRFDVLEGWEKLPVGYVHKDVDGVATDSRDRAYLLTRGDARVIVYERDGTFVTSWGEDIFTPRTHGICIGPDDSVWTVDDGDHTVRKFTPDGKQLMIIGTPGVASDTGYDGKTVKSITRGGPPFNRPTDAAVSPNGDLYVVDGYGNARVHHFTADGKLIRSWGEPGTGPGQFHLPHAVFVARDGRVLVADRENDRIQFFSPEGEYLDQWTHVQRPTDIYIDRDGLVYVSELWWRVGQSSFVHGPIKYDLPGRLSVFDLEGNLLLRWCSADRCAAGNFIAPHTLCVDSRGDLYVGEVTYTFAVKNGLVPADAHTFQKFMRK
ncbi:MAG: peptidyl-alpha-hydroxyglycine alpha-amidating lyase family protein [Candidatus Methylomirabilales bacterium]